MPSSPTSSPRPASAERLLDEALLRALTGLALPRRKAGGAVEGVHRGARGGPGEDFFQHRAYVAGEDLRSVDFRASARSGHLLVKELHRPLRQPLVALVDASASMGLFGKGRCARQLAAALGVLGLRRGDPFSLLGLEGGRARLLGRLLSAAHPTLEVEALVERLPAGGRADLAAALAGPLPVKLAGAHLVVVSDLYGEAGATRAALSRLRARAGAVTVLQVLAPEERALPLGLEQLEDVETGAQVQVGPGGAQAYAERVRAWRTLLREAAVGSGGEWVDVDAAAPVGGALRAWLGPAR